MTIKLPHAPDEPQIHIDAQKCVGCGACLRECNSDVLVLKDGKMTTDGINDFGCVACGHCEAVCPTGAIQVRWRGLTDESFVDMPKSEEKATYDELMALLLSRRSCRQWQDKEVLPQQIDHILAAARLAPSGIPPTGVRVRVFANKSEVRAFSFDFIDFLASQKWIFSFPARLAIKLFFGESKDLMESFALKAIRMFIDKKQAGEDWLLYNAPAAFYFYGNQASADPADTYIACTYAMLAAESLGLGTCMIGSIGPILQYGGKSVKEKYGLPKNHAYGIVLLVGHAQVHPKKAIKRTGTL